MSIETEAAQPADVQPAEVQTPDGQAADGQAARQPEGSAHRLYILDLLRFGAALAIIGYHFIPSHEEAWGDDVAAFGTALKAVLQYAWLGVEAFFVISGFVICMSSWGRSPSQFFISRVSRLMPAYMFAVLLTATVISLIPQARERPHISHTFINLTMLQKFLNVPSVDSVYWTLFVELKFYLLFAIVVHFGVTYRRVVLFCLLWTVATLVAIYTGSAFLNATVEPFYAPLFVAGITLFLIHRFGPNLLLWCMLGTSVAIAMSCLAQRDPVKRGITSYPITVTLMLAFIAIMVAVSLGWFSWVRWRGLVTIGALTYPAYLLHHGIGLAVIGRLHDRVPPWVLLTAVVLGVLLLSYATHRLVERPLSRALRRGLGTSFARIRAADATSAKQSTAA